MTRPTQLGRGGYPLDAVLGGAPGTIGGTPSSPDCCDVGEDPPDLANSDNTPGVAVALSTAGSIAFVQKVAVNIDNDLLELPASPTEGNLLVLWVTARSAGANGFTPPTGFTQVGSTVTTTSDAFVQRKGAMAYRIVQSGDSDTVDIGSTFGVGTNVMGSLAEFSGAAQPDDDASLSNQSTNTTSNCGGPVTPTSVSETLLVGATVIGGTDPTSGGDGASALTPGASITELHDLRNNNDSSPRLWNGYRIVTTPSGSYSITATQDDATARVFGGVSASFIGADSAWNLPAPNAVDGDDTTYHTVTGTDLLRRDLGAAHRIVRTRIRVAANNSGARTFTIKGANVADFSDEVTLATIPFTATGSYTAQDVTAQWITNTSYRYFELSISDSDTYRVHTWELYEATPGAIIVEDPTNGGAADDLQDVLDNIAAEGASAHIADTTDAHDASAISYDNATSGLTATDVQDAIDELEGMIGSPSLALDDLTDVDAPSPADGDVLTWNDGDSEWQPAAPTGASDLDDLTDVVITSPQANDTLRYVGGQWINDDRRWEPVTFNFGSGPELVWDGDDLVMEWKEY